MTFFSNNRNVGTFCYKTKTKINNNNHTQIRFKCAQQFTDITTIYYNKSQCTFFFFLIFNISETVLR